MYATLVFKVYTDLSKLIEPACICNNPKYLEILSVLNSMHNPGRLYNIGEIFENAKTVKNTTIRSYISQRKTIRPEKISGILYDNYFNRADSSPLLKGNRLAVLKYISKQIKSEYKITYTHKQKEPIVYQYKDQVKIHVDWSVYIIIANKGS